MIYKTILGLLILLLTSHIPVLAQESNVNPGINTYYQNPDFEQWVSVFESDGREVYGRRKAIITALDLKPGMKVADIGAGTGFYSLLFARQVGPEGHVYAVDIASEFVKNILLRASEKQLDNVTGVVNNPKTVELPENHIDLAFICDTYHHFEYPMTTMQSIYSALKPGGEVVIIDFRKVKGFSSPWVMNHVRADKLSVIREIEAAGFKFKEEQPLLRTNYFLRFVKP
jgi:ubiquinone/menaquinone biosynthesis C-methylase UbiE